MQVSCVHIEFLNRVLVSNHLVEDDTKGPDIIRKLVALVFVDPLR